MHTMLPIEPRIIDGRRGVVFAARGGERVFCAPVKPEDAQRLRRGVEEMSPLSRYFRFLSPLRQLTEEQIERFTNPDQIDHIAWGTLDLARPGLPGIGLARMVREADSAASEFAIAVIDDWQNLGVGRVLLAVLLLMAERRELCEVYGYVSPDNECMIGWMTRLGAKWRRTDDGWRGAFAIPYHRGDEAQPTSSAHAMRLLIDTLDCKIAPDAPHA